MGIKALGNLLNLENRFTRALPNDSTGTRGAEILGFTATGGNQNTSTGDAPGNGYKYHVFTSPGTLTIQGGSKDIQFLVVGGGGGGGFGNGGGAGAGGLRTNDPNVPSDMKITSTVTLNPGSYAIGVGTGGNSSGAPFAHRLGEDSSIGSLVIASGGGAGGPMPAPDQVNYQDAGSGGGQEAPETGRSGVTIDSPDSLSPDKQGYNGGSANGGGGGGGAGGNGSSSTGGSRLSCPAFSSPIIHPICPMPSDWQGYVGSGGAYAGGGYGYPGRSNSHNDISWGSVGIQTYAGIVNTGGGADSNDDGLRDPGNPVTGGKGIVIIRYQPD